MAKEVVYYCDLCGVKLPEHSKKMEIAYRNEGYFPNGEPTIFYATTASIDICEHCRERYISSLPVVRRGTVYEEKWMWDDESE